jgi:hypothetical protein
LLSAESIAPPPSPSGSESKQRKTNSRENEKPSSAVAVTTVETAVTLAVPKRFMSLALIRLEITVPAVLIRLTKLPIETGKFISAYIAGQAGPKSESGMPSPMKSIKIITSNIVAIFILR